MNAWIKNKTKVFIATTVLTFEGTIKYISNYEVVIIPDKQHKPIILFKSNIISIMKHDLYQKMMYPKIDLPKGSEFNISEEDKKIIKNSEGGSIEGLNHVIEENFEVEGKEHAGADEDVVVDLTKDEFGSEEFGGNR